MPHCDDDNYWTKDVSALFTGGNCCCTHLYSALMNRHSLSADESCSYMVSFSSQMLLSDLHLLSSQVLFRTIMLCLLLFLFLFLFGFFGDLCFLDSPRWALRYPSDNCKTEPLHHLAELHPSCYSYDHRFPNLFLLSSKRSHIATDRLLLHMRASACFKSSRTIPVPTCPPL